ncbi:MAG: ATP-grasp domain-containing protein [Kofleriaceae bacterium]|nr:ATP-grasp domain-containing protein [Kofleriaceae bacterium]
MRPLRKVVIANRGEIAIRIMRSCHQLGLATVAVYSEADRDAPFVRYADEAVCIGAAPARESYLVSHKILDAARQTGADAVHPGYGFLSENADFAEAVIDAGLTFIGPPPVVIRALGKKREAKELAIAAGVPVVPGYNEPAQDLATLRAAADRIGYPILVKASAGGGGKGMRVVRHASEVEAAIERASSEALAAFGDGALILERYIERPRHIEIQILGDQHGNLIHLWERECSIQRRHQKIIEETPSVALSAALREQMTQAATALGRAVGYISAGTVEFIVDQAGAFYFLEVNTRLQVEHPVTELTCGIDLVAEQLRIARGEPLRWRAPPMPHGHAIEVRWCAEDPDQQFLPTTGRLLSVATSTLPSVRHDLGVATGAVVGIHYDSMLGKIIAHAATRNDAISLLQRALGELWAPGVVTNREYLQRVLALPAFVAGHLHTHFVEQYAGELAARTPGLDQMWVAAVAATLVQLELRRRAVPADAIAVVPGWRNVRFADQLVTYAVGDQTIELGYLVRERGIEIAMGGKRMYIAHYHVATDATSVWFEQAGGLRRTCNVACDGATIWIGSEGRLVRLVEAPRFVEPGAASVQGGLTAPMPGKVIRVVVKQGALVAAGDALLILEAMKMEHTIRAPTAGLLTHLYAAVGDQIEADKLLAVIEPSPP